MRFVFTPPADYAAGLLTLPWSVPLEDWRDERLVEIRQRGISRHVVRFVYDDGTLYALKELSERLARREYRLLRVLADLNVPAVEAIGIAVDLDAAHPRQSDADAILVTKFLTYATTYRAVFSHPWGIEPIGGLLDALVELLVRLHMSGFSGSRSIAIPTTSTAGTFRSASARSTRYSRRASRSFSSFSAYSTPSSYTNRTT